MSESNSSAATPATPQIVHEAEAQRQHIRINLPASISVQGHNFKLADWSVGGVSLLIDGATPSFLQAGTTTEANMHFEFLGFSLTVPTQLEINASSGNRVGCKFVNMDRNHVCLCAFVG